MTIATVEDFDCKTADMPSGWGTPRNEGPSAHIHRTGHALEACESDEGIASIICGECAMFWLVGRRPSLFLHTNIQWADVYHKFTRQGKRVSWRKEAGDE